MDFKSYEKVLNEVMGAMKAFKAGMAQTGLDAHPQTIFEFGDKFMQARMQAGLMSYTDYVRCRLFMKAEGYVPEPGSLDKYRRHYAALEIPKEKFAEAVDSAKIWAYENPHLSFHLRNVLFILETQCQTTIDQYAEALFHKKENTPVGDEGVSVEGRRPRRRRQFNAGSVFRTFDVCGRLQKAYVVREAALPISPGFVMVEMFSDNQETQEFRQISKKFLKTNTEYAGQESMLKKQFYPVFEDLGVVGSEEMYDGEPYVGIVEVMIDVPRYYCVGTRFDVVNGLGLTKGRYVVDVHYVGSVRNYYADHYAQEI